jgi:hypothetical protein
MGRILAGLSDFSVLLPGSVLIPETGLKFLILIFHSPYLFILLQ